VSSVGSANDFNWHDMDSITRPEAPARSVNTELDRDAFLMLLLTQLQHQDPFNPVEDTDFIAQLAQFTTLEQMQQMNASTTRSQAFTMVGRSIAAEVRNEQTGVVDGVVGQVVTVTLRAGVPYLRVEGPHGVRDVAMTDVTYVGTDISIDLLSSISTTLLSSQNMDLIGQFAQFVERDREGNVIRYVEGEINSLRFDRERGLVLNVGPGLQEVIAAQLLAISSSRPLMVGNEIAQGRITETSINDGVISLVVEAGGNTRQIPINDISVTTNALRLIGRPVSFGDRNGIVDTVSIEHGDPVLVLDNGQRIPFLTFVGLDQNEVTREMLPGRDLAFATGDGELTNSIIRLVPAMGNSGTVRVEVNGETQNLQVNNINHLTRAFSYLNTFFGSAGSGGFAEGVVVRNGEVYLQVLSSGGVTREMPVRSFAPPAN
jgi:flagellar hook assembly protein FlgD